MKKYYLVSTNKFNRHPDKEEILDFSSEEFEKYKKDELPQDVMNDFEGIAIETQGLEWWIEEVED